MKLSPLAVSLLAISMFALPVAGPAATAAAEEIRMAQADTGAVQAILQDDRPASAMSEDELKQRIRQARDLIKSGTLDRATRRALQAKVRESRQELVARGVVGGNKKKAAKQTGAGNGDAAADESGSDDDEGGAPQDADANDGAAKAAGGADALLADKRPAAQLSDDELRSRLKQARTHIEDPAVSAERRQALRALAKQYREELDGRTGAAAQDDGNAAAGDDQADAGGADGSGEQQPGKKTLPIGTQVPDDVLAIVNDDRPATALSEAELKSRLQTGRSYLATGNPPQDVRRKLATAMKAMRQEAMKRGAGKAEGGAEQGSPGDDGTTPGGAPSDGDQAKKLDGNAANPQAEAKAKAFLDDPEKAEDLPDKELHTRLGDIRELLAGNQLSKETEKALRDKLKVERDVLRARVDKAETPGGGAVEPQTGDDKSDTDLKIILADDRDPDKLANAELRRRIDTYRVVVVDKRYSDEERVRWRRILDRDREILRKRLIDDRRQRADKLKRERDDLDIKINVVIDPDRPPPRDVFAAEVDDAEIEEVLLAPPRRKVERRYTIEEVEATPALRETVARIEIDNVRFGFGEAFIREEEVENLDRIAEIMERILEAHPGEVFLIEGHTDAVGSDAANLDLSRQRARAIREALTTYYVIPPENLKTIGYGERFLKIPTAEPEAENRRVSIARATVLLGEVDR